ncbi:unnamed protein product [Linum tenue]|uniref:Uncharacterized protein n=1 Tax=Linum tenue TaxID=586396 RepID=A0AAV0PJR3_9ROSI|nr:unnamed protein product [Linum tenue]
MNRGRRRVGGCRILGRGYISLEGRSG